MDQTVFDRMLESSVVTRRNVEAIGTIRTEVAQTRTQVQDILLLAGARTEANRLAALRSNVPATPAVEYGHMPLPLRKSMSVVTEWMLSKEIHHKFAQLCHCNGRKMKAAEELFDSHPSLAFPRYWAAMAKCKGKEKWRARAIAAQVPEEAALAIQSLNDAGRIIAVLFMVNAEPVCAITSNLVSREHFIDQACSDYMA